MAQASRLCRTGWKVCSTYGKSCRAGTARRLLDSWWATPTLHLKHRIFLLGEIEMEKVKSHKDYSFSYPFIIFYKEDLERLAEIFFENFSEIEIEADDFKLENINEITGIQKEFIQVFKIAGYDKANDNLFRECKIRFHLTIKSAVLYINDSNELKCRGIQNELETIIKKRTTFINILDSKWLLFINSLLLIFALEAA